MSSVLYEIKNSVAVITLNRPEKYNAVNDSLTESLTLYLSKAKKDQEVRAIVITGAGNGFCAGADMSYFSSELSPEKKRRLYNQHLSAINKYV